jgi:heat shock protein HslJ
MIKRFLAGVSLMLIVAGCSQTPAQTPRISSVIEDREWELVGFEKTSMQIPKNATLLLIDGRYMGNAGCNSMGGEYQINADRISFNAGYSTKMSCADMDLEMKVLGLMQKVDQFNVDGSRLSLMHKGQVLMHFIEK